jgi:hypothetical protein
MKWTISDLETVLMLSDWGLDDDKIAEAMGRSVSAIQHKVGRKSPDPGSRYFVTHDLKAATRHELRRALSKLPAKREQDVGVRAGPGLQNRRIQIVDRNGDQPTQLAISRNDTRALQADNPITDRAEDRPRQRSEADERPVAKRGRHRKRQALSASVIALGH